MVVINPIVCKELCLIMVCDQSKKEGKDQESTQSSNTPDPGYQFFIFNTFYKNNFDNLKVKTLNFT